MSCPGLLFANTINSPIDFTGNIEFTATKYESNQINEVARALVGKQTILKNYTYFQSGYVTSGTGADNVLTNRAPIKSASWGTDPKARTVADPVVPVTP